MLNLCRDQLKPQGRVELFVARETPRKLYGKLLGHIQNSIIPIYDSCELQFDKLLDTIDIKNILVDGGKDRSIECLTTGHINVVARMAIGDRGTIPSDITVPKVPTSDMDGLFNEVYRDDAESVVLNVGTPGVHEVKFIKTFSALIVPITAFSNQARPLVNEVGLIMIDPVHGSPLPRPPVAAPEVPPADESLFAIRTFKSVPFEAANEITITIRYTIFIE